MWCEKQIGRLEVAMHEPATMHSLEGGQDRKRLLDGVTEP